MLYIHTNTEKPRYDCGRLSQVRGYLADVLPVLLTCFPEFSCLLPSLVLELSSQSWALVLQGIPGPFMLGRSFEILQVLFFISGATFQHQQCRARREKHFHVSTPNLDSCLSVNSSPPVYLAVARVVIIWGRFKFPLFFNWTEWEADLLEISQAAFFWIAFDPAWNVSHGGNWNCPTLQFSINILSNKRHRRKTETYRAIAA